MIVNFDIPLMSYEDLLTRISERDIYEYYFQEPIQDNRLYTCPFHKDKSPSLGFKLMPSTMLLHRCFGCGESGSAINFVSKLFGCSTQDAVKRIYRDLNLSLSENKEDSLSLINQLTTPRKRIISDGFNAGDNTVLIPIQQNFTIADYDYWKQYYITLLMLTKYSISSCKEVYIKKIKENKIAFFAGYSKTNPMYCYKVGDKYKIYRPLNPTKRGKWLSTTKSTDIQGMVQLPSKGDLLIITSSMKDLMVLKLFGYNAIALGGEGNRIPAKLLDYLYASFTELLVFYDNDEAGLKYGEKLASDIGCNYTYIPTKFENEKDISDFIKSFGKDQTRCLLNELVDGRNNKL